MENHRAIHRAIHRARWLAQNRLRRKLALLLTALAFVAVGIAVESESVLAAPDDFDQLLEAPLAGAEESTPNESIATGRAVFAVSEGNGITHTVSYRLTVADIVSVTAAHLHTGLPGVDGPIFQDLLNGAPLTPESPVSGEFTITVADELVLSTGGMYVNVHTEDLPGGEIRGQVAVIDVPAAQHALLLGHKERPDPVETDARGIAQFGISSSGMVTYSVNVADIQNVTAAHIHRGSAEEAGPIVFDLNGGALSPAAPLTGSLQFGPGDMVDLVTGFLYVNVHTDQHPGGEIRGQLTNASLFQADLTGSEEVPAVDTLATGRAVLGLDASATTLFYRVLVNDIEDITAAHIHLGTRGQNGGVEIDLFPSGAFTEDEPLSGSALFSVSNVLDLLGGMHYINVHTDAYMGGEIRGQVMEFHPQMYQSAILMGSEEVPPVETDARGLARFRVNAADSQLHYTVFGRDLDGVTMAHIHFGARGENGPIVFDFDGAGFDEANPLGGAFALNAENLVDLWTGFYYVNVHTAEYLDGEVRGQIGGARTYDADLSGANERPIALSPASGRSIFALSADATALSYHIAVDNLPDITMAHIHRGEAGVNGPVVVDFMPPESFGPGSPISGTVPITHGLVFDLARDALYVNIHSTPFPAGEVRGQILPLDPGERRLSVANGAQEVPAVETNGAGLARLRLDTERSMLRYDLMVDEVDDVTLAHIHRGSLGENGPVVHNLLGDGRMLSDAVPAGGGVHLDAQDWVNLLAGRFYVNVHTAEHPGGEVRGQIGYAPVYSAALSGAHEVPPVETVASGMGVLAVAPDAHSFAYRLAVEDIADITMAHIHRGATGTNGPVVVDFMPPESFGPGSPISGTVPITRELAFDLARGHLYFNVHTDEHGGGEVRGQIKDYAPAQSYMATLTGAAEVPPVESEGGGIAWMRLDANSGYLHFGAAVRNLDDIEAAHIHSGAEGENGPIDVWLFDPMNTEFDEEMPISGGQVLSPMGLVNLLTGYYYVNVHTAEHPAGEIRGQVGGAALFQAALSGANEVPPVDTDALGRVVAALDADARRLSLRAQVAGLPQTQAAHIHLGAAGVNGPVIFDLLDNDGELDDSSSLRYTTMITLGAALDLIVGDYYVNVHTSAFPGGEVRGQLDAYRPPTYVHAGLLGSEEVPAVATEAAGITRFRLDPILSQVSYRFDVTDIDDVTMAHIHQGERGENGPVTLDFGLMTNELTPAAPVAGRAQFDGGDWIDLLTGNSYVNVHTQAHPGGEIRGQIVAATPFQANLTGSGEVPPVMTSASGTAVVALSGDTSSLDYRVLVQSIQNVTAAHIHTGAAGENGPVVRDLNGAGLSEESPIADRVPADNSLIFDMLRGLTYVNVHTAANPGGEIRDQLMPVILQTRYHVHLTEDQEVLPAGAGQTEPSGEAVLYLDPFAGVFHYILRVMNLDDIVEAHIHRGARGENGPVVFDLYAGEEPFDAETPISGALQLGSRDMVDLLTNHFYINVHTVDQPAGAIRGQIEVETIPEIDLYVPRMDRGGAQ